MRGTLDTPKGDTPLALTDTKVRSVNLGKNRLKSLMGKACFLLLSLMAQSIGGFIGSFRPNNDTGFMAIYTRELTRPPS